MKRKKFFVMFAIFALIFCAVCSLSLCVGETNLTPKDALLGLFAMSQDDSVNAIILHIRLPRLLTGVIAGGGLALAGCAMQSLFRNPMADPSLTGVSSGAALGGAIAVCTFSLSSFGMPISALVVGLLCAVFIWKVGRFCGKINIYAMLLAGIALNAFCAAIIGFLMYSSKEEGLRGFLFWSLGSLEFANWNLITLSGIACLAGFAMLMIFSRELNMMAIGEESAFYAGANIKKAQFVAMSSAVLLTAAAVSICGIIGFVGLMVPHIVRLISSSDNRFLMPLSAIFGAILITVCDILSRIISPELNIPIGIMTALLGAPFFIFLMLSKTKMNA